MAVEQEVILENPDDGKRIAPVRQSPMECHTKLLNFKDGVITGEETTILNGIKCIKIGNDTFVIEGEKYIEHEECTRLHTLQLKRIILVNDKSSGGL